MDHPDATLSLLAYRYPVGFATFCYYLAFALCVIFVGMVVWNAGVGIAQAKLFKFLRQDAWQASDEVIKSLKISIWWQIGLGAVWLYVMFLSFLPKPPAG